MSRSIHLRRRVGLARAFLCCLVFGMTLLVSGCDLFGQDDSFDVPPERLVALTAVYAETDTSGAPIQRIVLLDYDDPSRYKVVTPNDHVSVQPWFSRDKTMLVFGDVTTGVVSAPQLVRYDHRAERTHALVVTGNQEDIPVTGWTARIVWNAEGTGFYFTHPPGAFSMRQLVLFYSFVEQRVETVRDAGESGVLPVAMKGRDTLIVFSNEQFYEGHGPLGYYFMDLEGAYLGRIDNPHLELINQGGINTKAAYSPAWNDTSRLFAIAYNDSTFSGYRIAVTTLDGAYYKEYTSGAFIDDHPRWGPGGKTILFDRRALFDSTFTGYSLMEVDLETGAVREFARPEVFGAVALRFPDY